MQISSFCPQDWVWVNVCDADVRSACSGQRMDAATAQGMGDAAPQTEMEHVSGGIGAVRTARCFQPGILWILPAQLRGSAANRQFIDVGSPAVAGTYSNRLQHGLDLSGSKTGFGSQPAEAPKF
jgi:hypothetical protein